MRNIINKTFNYLKSKYVDYYTFKILDNLWNEYSKDIKIKELTLEQKLAIQSYWKPLVGKKVSTRWYQLIFSISGDFKSEYVPFEVAMKVQRTLSPGFNQKAFDDKSLYNQLLVGFNIPIRVALCSRGVYYLPESKDLLEVTFDEFILGITNIKDCIIKPCVGTDGGRGISSINVIDGKVTESGQDISSFIDDFQRKYGFNYCIERKIHECNNLQCLNPTSCNTLRIHTYRNRDKQEISFLSAYIRIGKLGKVVDNAYSGGYCGRISKDGFLDRVVRVYPYLLDTKTESGVDVNHYKILDFEKMVSTVKRAHSLLPMFDLIGWDVTTDEEGNVIIIEFNPNPDVRIEQCVFDTTCYGDLQETIIRKVYSDY